MDPEVDTVFKGLKEVLVYLKAEGWKVSKTSLYLHVSDGKLRPRKVDGQYEKRTIDKYAKTFLGLVGTPGKTSYMLGKLQEQRIAAETKKAAAQAETWATKTKIFSGAYVPKDIFEAELSKRAITLRADLENFCRYEAAGIVNLAGGDPDKIADLIEYMLEKVNVFLDRYAGNREFIVPAVAIPADLAAGELDSAENEE